MKWKETNCLPKQVASLPVRGAWIEIRLHRLCAIGDVSLPVRGAWIEIIFP